MDNQTQINRVARTLKHQGTVIGLYEDTMLINGHEAKWDFIHHDGAAAVVPVTDEGKILMVRQYRNALEQQTLEIPAGKLDDPEEATLLCAGRELEEETGYRSDQLEFLIRIYTTVAFCDEAIDIYVARDLVPSQQDLDEDEFIDVEAYALDELIALIYQGEITDGKTVAAIMAYAQKYK